MHRTTDAGRRGTRIVAELVVIILGVFIALAADRWNQARSEQARETSYLARFADEIREDSVSAARYLESRPAILAGLDSLIDFVDGSDPPADLVATTLSVSRELTLPPAVAWTEIQASNSLDAIRDAKVREGLTRYYARRDMWLLQWSRQDSRARDPLWDALYRTGLFDPRDELGSDASVDGDVLRLWPGMRQLLLGLGSGHYFQRVIATNVLEGAGAALRAVEARGP